MKKIIPILIISIFLVSLTSAYAADGDILWETAYDGGDSAEAYGVAVDSQNNVIVTGNCGTIKYDPSGTPLWPAAIGIDGDGVAVDSQDNIIVTGGSGTIKYDPSGTPLWPAAIGISGYGVAVDSQDNIIVIGQGASYFIEKRDANGNILWNKAIDITAGTDYGTGVAVDSQDNIVVTGWVYDPDPLINYASCAIKLSPSGSEIFRIYDNSGSRWSYKVAIDSYDNIVLAGGKYDPSGDDVYQWLTVKYDSNGKTIWERGFDYTLGAHDDAYDVAIDSSNNILVTGYVYNQTVYRSNYYTIKYEGGTSAKKSLPMQHFMKLLGLGKKD